MPQSTQEELNFPSTEATDVNQSPENAPEASTSGFSSTSEAPEPETTTGELETLMTPNLPTDAPVDAPNRHDEDAPEETFSPPRYRISTKDNGDIVLDINGTELRMPDELPKLNQIVKNPQLLAVSITRTTIQFFHREDHSE